MADLGKVVVTDDGNYSASITYEKLTFVHYQGDAYMTLKTVKGVTPTDDGTNYKLFCKSAELATASKAGIVLPDGTTTTVDSSGKLSVKKATTSAAGIVKPASTDFTMAADGTQKINTQFTQAAELANIIAGEAISAVLSKVSKAIATTMNLDQNALLKNMLTSIDGTSSEKVPTQAYIHTLVERIGMGTDLTVGADLTQAVNLLNSNLSRNQLIATSAITETDVKNFIISSIKNGQFSFAIVTILNDKNTAFFGESGNFIVTITGDTANYGFIAENLWNGKLWAGRFAIYADDWYMTEYTRLSTLNDKLSYTGNMIKSNINLVNTGDNSTTVVQQDFYYNNNDFMRVEYTKTGVSFSRYENGVWS